LKKVKPLCIWFTGLSGAGKTTLGTNLKKKMHHLNYPFLIVDGDDIRKGISKDLGFTILDRKENIRRAAELSKIILQSGFNVICCFISPSKRMRQLAKSIVGTLHFVEVFVDAPVEVCIKRDPKGIYAKALKGEIRHVSGIDSPYEPPFLADIYINTVDSSINACTNKLVKEILSLIQQ